MGGDMICVAPSGPVVRAPAIASVCNAPAPAAFGSAHTGLASAKVLRYTSRPHARAILQLASRKRPPPF
jgi:hypothetical protein